MYSTQICCLYSGDGDPTNSCAEGDESKGVEEREGDVDGYRVTAFGNACYRPGAGSTTITIGH